MDWILEPVEQGHRAQINSKNYRPIGREYQHGVDILLKVLTPNRVLALWQLIFSEKSESGISEDRIGCELRFNFNDVDTAVGSTADEAMGILDKTESKHSGASAMTVS